MLSLAVTAGVLFFAPAAGSLAQPRAFDGKVEVTTAGGPDQPPKALALVNPDGTKLPIADDDGSKMLFLDKELRGRSVRLTAVSERPGTPLRVEKVQLLVGGEVWNVDYWCENCQLSYTQPGRCLCCGAETVRRELPAKPATKAGR